MNQIFVCGDLHRNALWVEKFYKRNRNIFNLDGSDIIICLGDFGANFGFDINDYNFKKRLSKLPFKYFVIRGNHEQRPSIVATEHMDDWSWKMFFDNYVWYENDFPNIMYAEDEVAYYNIGGYKTLIIPGAYSVDKYYRLERNLTWFPTEQLTEAERKRGLQLCEKHNNKFDLILSHTCAYSDIPTDLFISGIDQSLVDNSTEKYIEEITQKVQYKGHLWGHYHVTREYDKHKAMLDDRGSMVHLKEFMNTDKLITY